jgi:hypothetical protein
MLKIITQSALTLGCLMNLTACSDTMTWQEEVKLNDGRVIVVSQKRQCEGGYTGGNMASCIEREAWLTLNLQETKNEDLVWHESLKPKVLNIHKGQLYIVGTPATGREFDLYGKPQRSYIGFRLEGTEWKRIPFEEIPEDIYDTNLVIDGAFVKTKFLTLAGKNSSELNGDITYPKYFKRIDPNHKSNFN